MAVYLPSAYSRQSYMLNKSEAKHMEPKDYTIVKIEGEYAYLRADGEKEDVFIAMALLPPGVDVGTRLHYDMLCYTVIEETK